MFTGIIEEMGEVLGIKRTEIGQVRHVVSSRTSGEISLQAGRVLEGTRPGDSIAVNGVCLTVAKILPDGFVADVMPETLRRTNLGMLSPGSSVNLERAMAADGRFGGHIVTGHIDGTGTIRAARREENAVWITVDAPRHILDLIVEKGSVAIDGVSLTAAELTEHNFSVSLIPHTGERTILLSKKAGDPVNLENDVIGKYIQKLITVSAPARKPESRITEAFLQEHGF